MHITLDCPEGPTQLWPPYLTLNAHLKKYSRARSQVRPGP